MGLCNSEVARKLNVTRSAVLRWKLGAEPSYYYGERLLDLHAQKCRMDVARHDGGEKTRQIIIEIGSFHG